jgi:hypothetical protein
VVVAAAAAVTTDDPPTTVDPANGQGQLSRSAPVPCHWCGVAAATDVSDDSAAPLVLGQLGEALPDDSAAPLVLGQLGEAADVSWSSWRSTGVTELTVHAMQCIMHARIRRSKLAGYFSIRG